MRQAIFAILTVILGVWGFSAANAENAKVRAIWTVSEGIFEPESVVLDEERGYIYVSNVVGYGLNGQGYISRLSMSGHMVDAKWIAGLNGPTGMAQVGTKLFVVDIDKLKVFDVVTKRPLAEYPTPDTRPCLNDVAISGDGAIFVSGSCTGTIYQLAGTVLTPLIENHDALRFVNGLFVSGEMLLSGGWQIRLWNRYTGAPLADGPVTRQGDVKDIDGIAWDGSAFLFSMVDDPRLWRLGANGIAEPVSDEPFHAADFFYDEITGLLIVPQTLGEKDHRVSAYRLTLE